MDKHRVWGWVPVSVLGFAVAGAAVLGILMQPASPATQLTVALSATFHARSYVSTTKYIPETGHFTDSDEHAIANEPNLLETIDNGIVSEIDVGVDSYQAVPESCRTDAKFVEFEVRSIGYDQQIEFLNRLRFGRVFAADAVSQIGDTYSVSRDGKEVESFVIRLYATSRG